MSEQPTQNVAAQDGSSSFSHQAIWNYAIFALSKSTTLIMTVVLARLLGPSDFGLFALALLVLTFFDYVRDLGVAVALIQREGKWADIAPTGLTLTVGFGFLIGIGALLAAPLAGVAFGDDQLTPLVRVLAIGLFISALSVLPMAALRRRLDYRSRLVPEFVGAITKAGVAIGLAAAGHGVWSLVWAQLASSLVTTAIYWIVSRSRLRFGLDRSLARELILFGLPVTAVAFLSFVVINTPTAAIGRELGAEQLGFYSLAYRLPELLVLNLCMVVGDVLFSALSRLQHDRPALVERYLSTVRAMVAMTAPVGLGLAAVSTDAVAVLYGADFAPAATISAALCVFTVFYSVNYHAGDAYKAIGRPGLLTTLGIIKLIVLIPVVWIAAGHSALAAAVAMAAVEGGMTFVRLSVVRHMLGVTIRRHIAVLWAPMTAALLMAAGVWALGHALGGLSAPGRLVICVVAGIILYTAALRVFAPALVTTAAAAVRGRFAKA